MKEMLQFDDKSNFMEEKEAENKIHERFPDLDTARENWRQVRLSPVFFGHQNRLFPAREQP